MSSILDDLRAARLEQGMSQQDLVLKLGMNSQSGFSRIERGFHSPTLVTLSNWANALGFEVTLRPKE
jgi:transcriptional regulator with XRE-family HTH domain